MSEYFSITTTAVTITSVISHTSATSPSIITTYNNTIDGSN